MENSVLFEEIVGERLMVGEFYQKNMEGTLICAGQGHIILSGRCESTNI